jgi:hypothetical protein
MRRKQADSAKNAYTIAPRFCGVLVLGGKMKKLILITALLTGCSSQKFDGLPVTTLTDSNGYTYEIQDNGKALHIHDANYTGTVAMLYGGIYLGKKMVDYGEIEDFVGAKSASSAYFDKQKKPCRITETSGAYLACVAEYECKK